MYDTALTATPSLNRRFIRLQAVLHLYAFYVCKQANYDWALDQIHDDFTPDVLANPPADQAQLAHELQQALALFSSSWAVSSIPPTANSTSNSHVCAVVSRALAHYKAELDQDRRKLEGGLAAAVAKINQACVRIWRLLVEWACIAKRKSENPKLGHQHATIAPVDLFHSQALQRLQNDGVLARLVQEKAASWEDYSYLVERWYNQFVKQCSAMQRYLTYPMTPCKDRQLLDFLVEDVIFKEGDIQAFFDNVDLRWTTHKRIVRKLVHHGLVNCMQKNQASLNLQVLDLSAHGQQEKYFYVNLVTKTLEQDAELETLIAKEATNWTIDRIMLLDKTIVKLALCEMLYFTEIPVKVSINEYIDLSKIYSMPKSSQFVNGLLDAIAATLHQGDSPKS